MFLALHIYYPAVFELEINAGGQNSLSLFKSLFMRSDSYILSKPILNNKNRILIYY